MAGVLAYFSLPVDITPSIIALSLLIGFAFFHRFSAQNSFSVWLLFVAAGLLLASAHTHMRSPSPVVEGFYGVMGTVNRLQRDEEKGVQLTLCDLTLSSNRRQEGQAIKGCLRLLARTEVPPRVSIGSRLRLRARISPPPGPVVPNGFDYARYAYFNNIKGIGYAVTPVTVLPDTGTVSQTLRYRSAVAEQIANSYSGDIFGLAVALSVGQRGAISDEALDDMRVAGLAHLLAISGLHMGLITGIAFWIFERLFAFYPVIGTVVLPRKAAAGVAFLVSFAYLLLSGMSVSTIRAFLMVGVALLAVVTDRRVISLRSVALAALVILVIDPFAACHVSFQLSFAATAGLVRFFESYTPPPRSDDMNVLVRQFYNGLSAVRLSFLATLISQLAIAPFALYHFGSVSVTGALANLIVMPVMAFWVMPLILIGLLVSLANGFWIVAPVLEPGLSIIFEIAATFADLPFASITVPQMPSISLILFTGGFLTILLFTHWVRFPGAMGLICCGTALHLLSPPPDMLIAGNAPNIALVTDDGLVMAGGRRDSYRGRSWAVASGFGKTQNTLSERLKKQCDPAGCIWFDPDNRPLIAKTIRPDSLAEDCFRVSLVLGSGAGNCAAGATAQYLSIEELQNEGPIAVWFKPSQQAFTDMPPNLYSGYTVELIERSNPKEKRRRWHSSAP